MKAVRNILLSTLLVASACLEQIDLDRVTLTPELGFPLANSQFTISEFLEKGESTGFIEQRGNDLVLVYGDTLFSQKADVLFNLPNQTLPTKSFTGIEFPFSAPNTTATVTSNETFTMTTNGEALDSVWLKDGSIDISITSDFPASIQLAIMFPSVKSGSTPLQLSYSYNYPGSGPGAWNATDAVPLQGVSIDLTGAGSSSNELPYVFQVAVTDEGQPILATNTIDIDIGINGLVFKALFGQLGTVNFSAPPDTINLDILNNAIGGTFQPADPLLLLTFDNSLGAEVGVDISSVGADTKNNGTMMLSGSAASAPLNPYTIDGPDITEVGQSAATTIELNAVNSNFFDIISNLPTEVFYEFSGQLNPSGSPAKNFVLDTSRVRIYMRAEVPLHGVINLSLSKSFDFDGADLDDFGEFRIVQRTVNELPLALSAQAYFLDGSGTILDSLYTGDRSVIKPAPVDANGESTGATEFEKDITLLQSQIDNIRQASRLLFAVALNSASAPNPVKILSNNKVTIQLGIKGNIEYTIE